MKLLFLGSLHCDALLTEIENNMDSIHFQNAPNVFQWSFINGLIENNISFDIVSAPTLPCWPNRYQQTYVNHHKFQVNNNVKGNSIKYSTIVGVKEISIYFNVKSAISKWVEKYKYEDKYILIYSTDPSLMYAASKIKIKYKNIKIGVIVTELPDYASHILNIKPISKFIQASIILKGVKSLYKFMDFYVLLSEFMKEKIPMNNIPFCILEGLYSKSEDVKSSEKFQNPTVLYTGTLQRFTSIDVLIKAFQLLGDTSYRLIICGSGQLSEYVKSSAQEDNRISFKGLVSRQEVLLLQRKSTLLVNPRQPNQDLTKYSFPSKTMEYMASGSPVLMYKLEGIPNEYFNYCYTVDDTSVNGLALSLQMILSKTDEELLQKGLNAQKFILNNKSAKFQTRKVLKLLELLNQLI
jgi:glycosyltransferase involved in cell wall biosynthesis